MALNYDAIFSIMKKVLLVLIGVAILNNIWSLIYFIIHVGFSSDIITLIFDIAISLLSFYLIRKDNAWGDLLVFCSASYGLYTSYVILGGFFSLAMLKWGLQIFFSNALWMALIVVGLIHLYLLIAHKNRDKK